jgi:hypothetical protein
MPGKPTPIAHRAVLAQSARLRPVVAIAQQDILDLRTSFVREPPPEVV